MKKFLLLLSALLTSGAVMAADLVVSITTDPANQKKGVQNYSSSFQIGEPNSDLTWTVANFNNNNKGWDNPRCGSKTAAYTATITTDFKISALISSVEVEVGRFQTGANDKMTSMSLLVSPNSDMSDATTYTADISGLPTAKNGTATITIDVPAPEGNMYYRLSIEMPKTTNNGVFSVNSLKYYGYGDIGTIEVPEFATIAEFLAQKPTAKSIINQELTAIYKNGRYNYLTDGTDFILAYDESDVVADIKLSNGDKVASATGTYNNQNGLPQLIVTEFGELTAGGTPVQPEVLDIEEIASDMLSKYVKLVGVDIVAQSKANNYTATDETGSITIYNTFNNAKYYDVVEVPEGTGFDVIGFVSIYNNTLQITPVAIEGGKEIETVATPVIEPANGSELNIGDKITITCDTEGAKIYFTTEDETPSAASQLYDGPLTYSEPCTIRAIAIKEGYFDSEVVEATYTTAVAGSATASVNFTVNGNIDEIYKGTQPLAAEGNDGQNNYLTGLPFEIGPLHIVLVKPEGSKFGSPRWWKVSDTKTELRVYQENVLTISVIEDGYKIQSVKFVQGNSSLSQFSKLSATVKTNVGDATFGSSTKSWSAEDYEVVNMVEFTFGASAQLGGFEIEYVADENAHAGIEEIAADNNSDAPVEYFNLQGVRVNSDNVTPGIYIRRQGTVTTKVLVK